MKYVLVVLMASIILPYGIVFLAYVDNHSIGKNIAVTAMICLVLAIIFSLLLLKGTLGKAAYILAVAHILFFSVLGIVVAGPKIMEGNREQKEYAARLDRTVVGTYGAEYAGVLIVRKGTTVRASGSVLDSLGYPAGLDLYPSGDRFFADSNANPRYFFSFRTDGLLIILKRTPTPDDMYIGDGIRTEIGRYEKRQSVDQHGSSEE